MDEKVDGYNSPNDFDCENIVRFGLDKTLKSRGMGLADQWGSNHSEHQGFETGDNCFDTPGVVGYPDGNFEEVEDRETVGVDEYTHSGSPVAYFATFDSADAIVGNLGNNMVPADHDDSKIEHMPVDYSTVEGRGVNDKSVVKNAAVDKAGGHRIVGYRMIGHMATDYYVDTVPGNQMIRKIGTSRDLVARVDRIAEETNVSESNSEEWIVIESQKRASSRTAASRHDEDVVTDPKHPQYCKWIP